MHHNLYPVYTYITTSAVLKRCLQETPRSILVVSAIYFGKTGSTFEPRDDFQVEVSLHLLRLENISLYGWVYTCALYAYTKHLK